jgi:membrane-associated protease RseP (regulator of RpoE activity)
MARAGGLTAALSVLAVGAAWAAGPCEEGRGQTGLAVGAGTAGLVVAAIEADSAAAASGVRVGDEIVQVNATLPRSCAEFARVVRDAKRDRKALLVLVRRGTTDVAVALGAATWDRAVAVVEPIAPAEPPSVRQVVAAPPPAPLPPETTVTLDGVLQGIAALAPPPRTVGLEAYQNRLTHLQRETETLAVRGSVPTSVVDGLRTVLRYYGAAGVAWDSEERQRESERRPQRLPANQAIPAPFFADSEVATAIDEFPFLRDTVLRDPSPGALLGESSGLWRPVEARRLLWERGRQELTQLTAWIEKASR